MQSVVDVSVVSFWRVESSRSITHKKKFTTRNKKIGITDQQHEKQACAYQITTITQYKFKNKNIGVENAWNIVP